jgi:hypothetical protein
MNRIPFPDSSFAEDFNNSNMKPSLFSKPHSGMNKSDSFITNEKQIINR